MSKGMYGASCSTNLEESNLSDAAPAVDNSHLVVLQSFSFPSGDFSLKGGGGAPQPIYLT